MAILPAFTDERARYNARGDAALWAPAAAAIGERHHLAGPWVPATRGFHVVLLGPGHVIKIFTPKLAHERVIERTALSIAAGRLPVATPEIVAEGDLEGWSYLVMARLGGAPMESLWPGFDPPTQLRLVAAMGELMAALHELPLAEAAPIAGDWPATIAARRAAMISKHRRTLDEAWIAEIEAFVAGLPPVDAWPVELALLHNDLHLDHLHVDVGGGAPRLVGLLDFADAEVGPRELDFVTIGAFVAPQTPGASSVFLRAYGLPTSALTPALARRLTGYVLTHRYCDLAPLLRRIPEATRPETLAALHQRMWDFA